MAIKAYQILLGILLFLTSCGDNKKQEITRLVTEWQGKEIVIPDSVTTMGTGAFMAWKK